MVAENKNAFKQTTNHFIFLFLLPFVLKKERVFFFRGSALQVFGQCVGLSPNHRFVVRNTGIEPVSQPWEGRILPLDQFR